MTDKMPSLPKYEVIENGKPVSQERIDPSVASFISQMVQTAQLVRLRKLEESKIPVSIKGLKYTVSDKPLILKFDKPLISFSLIHATSSGISVWVNEENQPSDSSVFMNDTDQTLSVDFTYPGIYMVGLQAESGKTSEVRMVCKEGKRTIGGQ